MLGPMTDERMQIYLAKAVGRGTTELAAFDAALVGAGVANFNLIRLSSVIPPNGEIVEVERCPFAQEGRWGDRLYAVYAEQRTNVPGEQVWAGVGWTQDRETGRGLFVEHEGPREQDVREQITASLTDLQAIRRLDLGPIHSCVIGAMCTGAPTCALVICGYGTEPWPAASRDNGRARQLRYPPEGRSGHSSISQRTPALARRPCGHPSSGGRTTRWS
jgi:arginine decarboxylase